MIKEASSEAFFLFMGKMIIVAVFIRSFLSHND